jgi:hypothetical protein
VLGFQDWRLYVLRKIFSLSNDRMLKAKISQLTVLETEAGGFMT